MQTLVVRPRESAAALHRRLLSPANARPDAGIDLKRKPVAALMPLVAAAPPIVVAPVPEPEPEPEPETIVVPVAPAEPPPWLEALTEFNETLLRLFGGNQGLIRLGTICRVVAEHYRLSLIDIEGPSRHKEMIRPRFVAMFLCWEMASASTPRIGRHFGNRHHTTVMHGLRCVQGWMASSEEFKDELDVIAAKIRRLPS